MTNGSSAKEKKIEMKAKHEKRGEWREKEKKFGREKMRGEEVRPNRPTKTIKALETAKQKETV